MTLWLCVILGVSLAQVSALDNGLALSPPMGWMSWLRFGCNVDCVSEPDTCISEDLIKRTADRMVSDGYKDAGYEYVIIDDCWLEKERSEDGKLVADRKRFKSGIKALADYVHSKGLKFGIYQDIGTKTCQGYPGLEGHEEVDVKTLASWEIDYLKVDGCYQDSKRFDKTYPALGRLLNQTGRPILYSCSWPAYQAADQVISAELIDEGSVAICHFSMDFDRIWYSENKTAYSLATSVASWICPKYYNYAAISENCNIWRNDGDIDNTWESIHNIMDWFGSETYINTYAHPGSYNDPDMLTIGNDGVTLDQAKVQMAIWTILRAPLLMSTDLDTIKPEFKKILLNKEIISINQKRGMQMALRLQHHKDNMELWAGQIGEDDLDDLVRAIVNTEQKARRVKITHDFMHLDKKYDYRFHDLYNEDKDVELHVNGNFTVEINATGVKFYRINLLKPKKSQDIENIIDMYT